MLPDPLLAYVLGTAVREMTSETKRDIGALIVEGEDSTRLLVEALEHLRAPSARRLRNRILAHLDESKIAAIVRRDAARAAKEPK